MLLDIVWNLDHCWERNIIFHTSQYIIGNQYFISYVLPFFIAISKSNLGWTLKESMAGDTNIWNIIFQSIPCFIACRTLYYIISHSVKNFIAYYISYHAIFHIMPYFIACNILKNIITVDNIHNSRVYNIFFKSMVYYFSKHAILFPKAV